LKLMGAGAAAVASLTLAGCGGKDQAKEGASGSGEPSGGSTSNTTVGQNGSTPKQGSAAEEVAVAAKRAMEKYNLKAVLVRVTKGTEEVATLVMGESMTGVPATVEMHFRNGAVAISYLGTVLLQLVDEGTVGLDDTIDEWLPKALASEKVTLRMLANCTSGYPDYVAVKSFVDALYKDPFRAWTTEDQVGYVADQPLLYEPGTNWSYSHTNFVILGEALSAITDKPVDELIRERIVEPLGMRGTQSHQTAEIPEPVLHAYTKERGTYEESTFWNPSWTLAKGSVMITDIYDLATSARAIGKGELVSQGAGRSFARGVGWSHQEVSRERLREANVLLPLRHLHLGQRRWVDTTEPLVLRVGRPASVPAGEGPGDRSLGDAGEGGQGGAQRWPDGLRRDRRRACTGSPARALTETTLFTGVRGIGILRSSLRTEVSGIMLVGGKVQRPLVGAGGRRSRSDGEDSPIIQLGRMVGAIRKRG
jgi:CubicO group peptidase (beta-lactamase class C family)